jgi:hypothetical protein
MDYPPPGSEFLPQDYSSWALPLPPPPHKNHTATNHSSLSHPQWLPLSPHDQPGDLSVPVGSAYGNTTALYSNGLASNHTSLFPNTNADIMVLQSPQLPVPDSNSSTDVQSMAPPPNPRKRKAPTLRVDDWEPVKARVIKLHITENLPLPEVKKIVEQEYRSIGFTAT